MDAEGIVTVLTWNLQGSHGVDTGAVGAIVAEHCPDVVAIQEIQRRQCDRLAAALGMRHRWSFKHASPGVRPEGMAVLTPHELTATSSFVLRRAPWWSWRRRIAQRATVTVGGEPGTAVTLVNVHLSPHDEGEARGREATAVVGRALGAVVAGDFNDVPGGPAPNALAAAGWCDAWAAVRLGEAGHSNWTEGPRAGRPPDQRLDYVMAPAGWRVVGADLGSAACGHERLGELSDHLPVVARLAPPTAGVRGEAPA